RVDHVRLVRVAFASGEPLDLAATVTAVLNPCGFSPCLHNALDLGLHNGGVKVATSRTNCLEYQQANTVLPKLVQFRLQPYQSHPFALIPARSQVPGPSLERFQFTVCKPALCGYV